MFITPPADINPTDTILETARVMALRTFFEKCRHPGVKVGVRRNPDDTALLMVIETENIVTRIRATIEECKNPEIVRDAMISMLREIGL